MDPAPSPTTATLFDVAFANADRGYIAGAAGTVLVTDDGGATWSTVESPTTTDLTDVQVLGPDQAVFTGPNQTVLHYLAAPVPTLIGSFVAAAAPFSVDLSWSVRDEASLSEFRIQRSDGRATRAFRAIAAASRSFRDDTVAPDADYEYILVAIDRDGSETYSPPIRVTTSKAELTLFPNAPNPFNPSTTIRYMLPSRERVRVTIYDVSGRLITTLVDRDQAAGSYDVEWKGLDAVGTRVSSGVYLVQIEAGKQSLSRKMVLLK